MHTLALIDFFGLDTEGYYASGKLILCVCSHRDRGFTYVWGGWGSLARGHNMHIPGNNQLCMGTVTADTTESLVIRVGVCGGHTLRVLWPGLGLLP